jgi:hypothetical protein
VDIAENIRTKRLSAKTRGNRRCCFHECQTRPLFVSEAFRHNMSQMEQEVDKISSKVNAISKSAEEISTTADKILSKTNKFSWPIIKKLPGAQNPELEIPRVPTQDSMEDIPRVIQDLNTLRSTSPLHSLRLVSSHLEEISGSPEPLVK